LDVSDFEPISPERHGQLDDLAETVEVLPMHDRVDGQRQPRIADKARSGTLCLLRSGEAGDAIAGDHIGILEAQLHVFETRVDQPGEAIGVQANAGSDQVPVESDVSGMADELSKITSDERFTT
jgi:hypothetical protein